MKSRSIFAAALLGFAICAGTGPAPVHAESLHVVRKGTGRDLSVAMNRAVVVESDVPFAELSIANPSIADFSTLSDRTIYVLGKSPGRTTLTLLDENGRLITNVEVRVSADVSEFKERLRQILPNERIEVRTANDGIVLSGTVSSTPRMQRALDLAERYAPERVSNLMSVSGKQQVMLKVRFAEMQRTVAKSLSTSLSVDGLSTGGLGVGASTNNAGASNANIAGVVPGTGPNGSANNGAVFFGFNAGSAQIGILMQALESKGVVRTLAEPNLTALSGQEAKFLAGGEYPIPIAQDNSTITVEYKPFGVELNFVPRVLDDDVINLEIAAAVSALDPNNGITIGGVNSFTINAFRRRDASTTIAMRDGESFAIAGLLQDDFQDTNGQIPWIGDIPILGALFRSADYQRSQTELVIIVTAHLVTPTKGEALALPTDRVRLPSEADLFLNGRVARNVGPDTGPTGEVAKQDFSGSYGYVMD
ncbi:type II and III secretion system protein family protein [Pseudohalocynthiibacter aestuariivivens]|uniref:Type II and III secretion system protein family protein n=1 Tax=Roseovarius pelagicus TaxID=2980108 RepID=A0ABY6D8M4_9RHOB|nr:MULTISPECIES: type II and III secretion system protein family protein [Rhodobacterales]QIE45604.1 type II and III secretion system protein family protein [Pseudohalocynthiibacter aestuariivivens]UXX82477.1 type II and III secretion system protein family protein [Roseovarius pelagicus]